MLRKMTVTMTGDGTDQSQDSSGAVQTYRTPMRVLRIDIDDSGAVGAGTADVLDELGTTLAADDLTTVLDTVAPSPTDESFEGVLAAGPLTFEISSGYTSGDVVFTVFYANE